jgi:FkbM family methyltransferase
MRDNGTDFLIFLAIFEKGEYVIPASLNYSPKIIYDLGADIGLTSAYFSSRYPESCIFGFEPVQDNFQIALKNFTNVKCGKLLNIGIGVEKKKMNMLIEKNNSGAHRLDIYGKSDDFVVANVVEVDIENLEELIKEGKIPPPDFLKIDTEGSEIDILLSLGSYLKTVEMAVIEPDGENYQKCSNLLMFNGFKIEKFKNYLILAHK